MTAYEYLLETQYLFDLDLAGTMATVFPEGTRFETPYDLTSRDHSNRLTIPALINGKEYYGNAGSLRAACGIKVFPGPKPQLLSPSLRPCEWRTNSSSEWQEGFFHEWVVIDENICGIAEAPDGTVDYFHISNIRFTNSPKEDTK